jgi:predicted O-methyltransferase YrrM
MISGNWQGTFLKILSLMLNPKRILEVGSFTGYSTICLSAGLTDGEIHTIEVDEERENFLKDVFAQNNLRNVHLHIGDALNIIPRFSEPFDIIFIDADKVSYPIYYELCKGMLRQGGILLADNILWYGKVALSSPPNDKQTSAIRRFNDLICADNDFDKVIIPIRDGIMLARRK